MSAPEREPATNEYVPSSPVFFRLIQRAMALFAASACALAALVPAPLQEPGDIGNAPNPARSAWFLLWIQELVSYGRHFIYLVAVLAACLLVLPYTRAGRPDRAGDGARRAVAAAAVAIFFAIVALTVIAYFFRGRNWAFSPGR